MNQRSIVRVRREIEIVAREIGGHGASGDRIKMGKVSVGGKEYIGVLVRGLGVNPRHFHGVKSVNALLLVPNNYPTAPPLGCYVDRPYKVDSSHFVQGGYHGAPSLQDQGWRWFCHGVGGFDSGSRRSLWRPGARPEDGHNLASVLAAARVAMNSGH